MVNLHKSGVTVDFTSTPKEYYSMIRTLVSVLAYMDTDPGLALNPQDVRNIGQLLYEMLPSENAIEPVLEGLETFILYSDDDTSITAEIATLVTDAKYTPKNKKSK